MKFFVPAIAAALLATPALAANTNSAQASTDQAAADESQNRMICKKQKVSGTRLSTKKVCMTAAQWEQIERDQREITERTQRQTPRSGG